MIKNKDCNCDETIQLDISLTNNNYRSLTLYRVFRHKIMVHSDFLFLHFEISPSTLIKKIFFTAPSNLIRMTIM